ncbi:MAG TPA: response regulator transcription factor [Bacteroidota bacterium]|nr:response regulator transcription factor [Bacteroidota bacterium]
MKEKKQVSEGQQKPGQVTEINILVMEDEPHIAESISSRLTEEGYAVDIAHDGEKGYELALSKKYHVIVLDLLLPRKDGLKVLRDLRRNKVQSMILILTAKSTIEDRVEGLRSGADDYLPKPFAIMELLARIETLLRRQGIVQTTILQVGDLELDTATRSARRANRNIHLTTKEYLLLELFMRNKNRILTRRAIAEQVWGYNFDTGTNLVDVYINYLRKSIDNGFSKRLIYTIRGVGFVLKEE